MLTARGKKNENIAEYLLYMWQIEDLIRAMRLDIGSIQTHLIDRYDQPEEVKREIREWYESLIEMMKQEGVAEKGHLQLNRNVIIELEDIHARLLMAPKEHLYVMAYQRTLPLIVELRARSGENAPGELETCFNTLYGLLMLKLQQKEISPETLEASQTIGDFLRILSAKYKQDKEEGIDLD